MRYRHPAIGFPALTLLVYIPVFLGVIAATYLRNWKWEGWQRINDFGQQRFYADDNAKLRPADAQRVIFFGDSITYLWKFNDPAFFQPDWIDRGIAGQTTKTMLLRFRQDVIDLHPHTVHIFCGINDMLGNTGPTPLVQIEENVETMVELAQLHGIRVVLGILPPSPKVSADTLEQYDRWLKSYAAQHGIATVDYAAALTGADGRTQWSADGIHPVPAKFHVMSLAADPVIRRDLAAPVPPDHSSMLQP